MASVVQVKTAFRRAPEPPAAVASVDEDGKSKKRRRGQNKARRFPAIRDPLPLCANLSGRGCCEGTLNAEGLCAETSGTHDIKLYLEQKGRDIGPSCHLFDTFGFCKFGVKCRFAASHLDENLNNMKKDDFHSPVSAGYAILSSDQLSQVCLSSPFHANQQPTHTHRSGKTSQRSTPMSSRSSSFPKRSSSCKMRFRPKRKGLPRSSDSSRKILRLIHSSSRKTFSRPLLARTLAQQLRPRRCRMLLKM